MMRIHRVHDPRLCLLDFLNRCAKRSAQAKTYRTSQQASTSTGFQSMSQHRAYSKSSKDFNKSSLSKFLQSRVTFKLATVMWVGISGSLILYFWRRNSCKSRKHFSKVTKTPTKENEIEGVANHLRFTGKVALVTGAAGDIGGATANRFSNEGATVILVDLPFMENNLKAKCEELKQQGAFNAFFITADVTKEDEVIKMVASAKEKAGRIDYFFNNAGVQGELCPLNEQRDKEFQRVINVNVYGVFLCMKYVSQAMTADGMGGVIVNTASLAGLLGPANMMAYTASKFAVVGMTKTASKDLSRHGIRVCAIAPGILEGRMWDTQVKGNARCRKRLEGDTSEVTTQEIREQEDRMINGTPLKRLGKLSEVASVVAFLCSDDASYLTGVTLPIDGGRIQ